MAKSSKIVEFPHSPAGEVAEMAEHAVLVGLLGRCELAGAEPGEIADKILARFGSLGRAFGAPHASLAKEVGPAIASELVALHALLLRVLELPLRGRCVISSWSALLSYCQANLIPLGREVFHVLFLDNKNQLIKDERMGEGSIAHAPVYPREIARRALELDAASVILVHNHPSGDPSPSGADIQMTKMIMDALKPLSIGVHDHLIIGAGVVESLKQRGLM